MPCLLRFTYLQPKYLVLDLNGHLKPQQQHECSLFILHLIEFLEYFIFITLSILLHSSKNYFACWSKM